MPEKLSKPQIIADDVYAYLNGSHWRDYASCSGNGRWLRFQYDYRPYLVFRVVDFDKVLIETDNIAKAIAVWDDA